LRDQETRIPLADAILSKRTAELLAQRIAWSPVGVRYDPSSTGYSVWVQRWVSYTISFSHLNLKENSIDLSVTPSAILV
jgi:hypothetical protein